MKKLLILTVLMMSTIGSANAYQLQESQIARQASQQPSGKQIRVYNQYGSLNGYAKNMGNGQVVTYDKYHSRNGKYKVSSNGNRVKFYTRAGH